jgi:hypothetical protein
LSVPQNTRNQGHITFRYLNQPFPLQEDVGLAPHTDLEKELEKLKLKYNNVLEESEQKERLIEELRSVIVKKAQIRQVKDGVKNCKINVELLEGECSAV